MFKTEDATIHGVLKACQTTSPFEIEGGKCVNYNFNNKGGTKGSWQDIN